MSPFLRTGPRLLAHILVVALFAASPARAGEGFGTSNPFELQPEADVFQHLSQDLRLILQVPATYSPENGYSDIQANLFVSWVVAPFQSVIIVSPDIAKTRSLDLRAGTGYFTTTTAGDTTPLQRFLLFAEVTPRGKLPGEVAFVWRNRYEARWRLDTEAPFNFRLRTRLQVERDFLIPGHPGDALTPYASAEFIWTSSNRMWQQTRLLVGLVYSVKWFGKGQSFEVNGGTTTNLQPSRSTAPVLGLVYNQYLD